MKTQADKKVYLSIVADDFGMHTAINHGIQACYRAGTITDASLMASAPAFDEAAGMARDLAIPVGLHATFTRDFDVYRWGALTGAASLHADDGAFHTNVEDAWRHADLSHAKKELEAQHEALIAQGLKPTHLSEHMDMDEAGRMAGVMRTYLAQQTNTYRGRSLCGQEVLPAYALDSLFVLSAFSLSVAETRQHFLHHVLHLPPGHHVVICHPAADHPDLYRFCSAGMSDRMRYWAREYRLVDAAVLQDPEVAKVLHREQICLASLSTFPRLTQA